MKQHVELIAKAINIKEHQTGKGWLYSFSVPISEMDGENQITEWLQCSVFFKERDPRLVQHKGEFHITGKFTIKKAYGDYPQRLGFFGFEMVPVLGSVYRINKPKAEPSPQPDQYCDSNPKYDGYSSGGGMNNPSQNQVRQHQDENLSFPEQSQEMPF